MQLFDHLDVTIRTCYFMQRACLEVARNCPFIAATFVLHCYQLSYWWYGLDTTDIDWGTVPGSEGSEQ